VPSMGEVHLREGRVTYRDDSSHTEMAATLAEVHATTMDAEQRLTIEGVGQLASMPLQFTLYAGTLQDVSANKPFPVQVQLITPPWQVDLHGTMAQPLQLQGVAAEVSLTRFAPEQPSDHHEQAPYQLTGHLTQEGDGWAVRGLAGTLGKACHDLFYISGDFRRLYPVCTNSKSISCGIGKRSCAGRLNDRGRYSTKDSCGVSGSSEPWGDAKRVG
jgi:hypothetical protein